MQRLDDLIRPHVPAIVSAARAGDRDAQEIMNLYQLHVTCPEDPGAPTLCRAVFDSWIEKNDDRKK
jgi:hypothetical protein